MKTSAILFTAVNRAEMGHVQIPDPADDEILIETLFTCISPGTECRILSAHQERMEGYPIIPGYANVGRVVGRGQLARIPEGTLVFSGGTSRVSGCQRMWGGHIAHAIQPESRVFPLPAGVDPIAATALKLAAISLHGSRVAPAATGDRVLVVGLGPIGQLSARHYHLSGAQVLAIDMDTRRVEFSRKSAIEAIQVPAGESTAAAVHKRWPEGADFIVDCTGAVQAIPELIKVARELPWDDQPNPHRQSTYVLQGSFASDIHFSYWDAFMKELRFVLPRDQQPQDIRISLNLLAAGKLKLRDLISEMRRPFDAARAYADLQDSRYNLMTIAFDWRVQTGH